MERYCESKGCLRKQMLGYFGQGFDEAECMFRDRRGFNFAAMCHNCAKRTPMKLRNVSNLCQIMLPFMREAASVGLLTLSKIRMKTSNGKNIILPTPQIQLTTINYARAGLGGSSV